MLLAIDIGNTNMVLGVYEEERWVHQWRIHTDRERMVDEYVVLLRALLREEGLLDQPCRVALCSVVPPLTDVIAETVSQVLGEAPLVVGPGVRTGVRVRTDNPSEVGADLVANAAAAYDRFRDDCLVVDFGTATTFTAVAAPGDLLGVAIAPGLGTAASALAEKTAQLPRIQLQPPPSAIGRNTIHSMQAGLIYGHVGMVKEILSRMGAEMGGEAQAVATGGLSGVLAPLVGGFTQVDPGLTLDGVRLIATRNA
jgi:type III pantothenate kinase